MTGCTATRTVAGMGKRKSRSVPVQKRPSGGENGASASASEPRLDIATKLAEGSGQAPNPGSNETRGDEARAVAAQAAAEAPWERFEPTAEDHAFAAQAFAEERYDDDEWPEDGRDPWERFKLTAGARALFLASDAEHESDGLTALAKLVELRRTVDIWIAQTVGRGRGQGATWAQLATVLHVQRQAVWERYTKGDPELVARAKEGERRARAGHGFNPDA